MIQGANIEGFKTILHEADFCVVGGGIAGMLAAIGAARHGVKTVIMQDRPVFGGNASSEIRMTVGGAWGENNRETGIIEEIALEQIYRNPTLNFSIWDSVLYEKVRYQDNIEILLNCSCQDAEMDGASIKSITGWQTTTQQYHKVCAKYFADCSGDSVLAPITGAQFRIGREARDEFNEDIEPVNSDNYTMGMSCLIQARQTGRDIPYIPPKWANKYTPESLPLRLEPGSEKWKRANFWWMELGGMKDSIHDTESIRDELLKVAFGVWDLIKNSGEFHAEGWELEWVGFLPGKRESRRYVGDYILNQNDVAAEGKFDDIVAYGGWAMDDHHPAAIETSEKPTIFHHAPSPYGIPYRCLYSANIDNLFFAGRNISATHAANSSTRVIATCGIIGQAVGTAVAIASKYGILPRQVYKEHIVLLQKTLQDDDCYLPFRTRAISEEMQEADIRCSAEGDIGKLIDGYERDTDEKDHAFETSKGAEITINFKKPLGSGMKLRMILDSDINRKCFQECVPRHKKFPMHANIYADAKPVFVPPTILKEFDIEAKLESGEKVLVDSQSSYYQRMYKVSLPTGVTEIKLKLKDTNGADNIRIYSVDVINEL